MELAFGDDLVSHFGARLLRFEHEPIGLPVELHLLAVLELQEAVVAEERSVDELSDELGDLATDPPADLSLHVDPDLGFDLRGIAVAVSEGWGAERHVMS